MAEGPHAMDDLNAILESRVGLYAMADVTVDTSAKGEAEVLAQLLAAVSHGVTEHK
jgi:hypothetical protein